jgi:NAD(P)H-flavin reductase
MAIVFEGKKLDLLADETVLDGLERHGFSIPSLCRAGVCQSCVLEATRGALPAAAQQGLQASARRQSLFLACMCRPREDLEIQRCGTSAPFHARVERVEHLSRGVLRVMLTAPAGFEYEAGQFIHLERPADGLMRPYSIASLPSSAGLELHVALLRGGAMSGWLREASGQDVVLRGPFGGCFYMPGEPERPLLLAGTGTGLAPLLGVVRAALAAGHRAPIRLYHGSVTRPGLYLWDELCSLLAEAPALSVTGSVLDDVAGVRGTGEGARCQIQVTPLDELVLADPSRSREDRVYLCGHPELVRKMQKKLYLSGVSLDRIHSDPFVAPAARG